MKKIYFGDVETLAIIAFSIAVFLVITLFTRADGTGYSAVWQYADTNNTVVAFTNRGINALQIAAIEIQFSAPVSCDVVVSRIKNNRSYILRSYTLTSATNMVAFQDNFKGIWFEKDDAVRISNDATNSVTVRTLLDMNSDKR